MPLVCCNNVTTRLKPTRPRLTFCALSYLPPRALFSQNSQTPNKEAIRLSNQHLRRPRLAAVAGGNGNFFFRRMARPAYPRLPPPVPQEQGRANASGRLLRAALLAVHAHDPVGATVFQGPTKLFLQLVENTPAAQEQPLSRQPQATGATRLIMFCCCLHNERRYDLSVQYRQDMCETREVRCNSTVGGVLDQEQGKHAEEMRHNIATRSGATLTEASCRCTNVSLDVRVPLLVASQQTKSETSSRKTTSRKPKNEDGTKDASASRKPPIRRREKQRTNSSRIPKAWIV